MDASELFSICRELATEKSTPANLRRMHEVLALSCEAGTRGHTGRFGNLFSQVDYLCKRLGMTTAERMAVQTARRHAANNDEPDESQSAQAGEATAYWLYDLRALTLFVSRVFATSVPTELTALLPKTDRHVPGKRTARRPYIRCIVRHWDATTIVADSDDGEIAIDYGSTEGGRDFSYLRKLLQEGMQLNLLDCEWQEKAPAPSKHAPDEEQPVATVLPRFVVVEPDFLLDVSAIAACFTPYGHHPLLYTVNRLQERPNTQAILLGNYAGTALDDLVNGRRRTESGEDGNDGHESLEEKAKRSLRRSFREQAIRFCACKPFNAEAFKRDALTQTKNIAEAVDALFGTPPATQERTAAPTCFSLDHAILEPSFVCERLGLQGRADLMTTDMQLLVEQKSGKNMKIECKSHDSHGLQREDHYVQLLLYYGILRYNFGRTDRSVDIRLLYSKYHACDGLLIVNYYQQLFREAMRLRNQIVATELFIAREGFDRIMPMLKPGIIYKEVKPDGFFTEHVLPRLQTLDDQLSSLNAIERAYYNRMMTFVYREQACQKLGNGQSALHPGSGSAADLWQMPLAEKTASGNIITGLHITHLDKSERSGGYDLVTLKRPHATPSEATAPTNFRRGDMVYLYAYSHDTEPAPGHTPDVRRSILFKGTLENIVPEQLTVRLNNGQQNRKLLGEGCWAVEHGSSDLMASTALRSIHQFSMSSRQRKDLLLGQRAPQADTRISLSKPRHPAYDAILLRAMQASDYFLLVGPPGTGKTSMALRFLAEEELSRQPSSSLLLSAYTNRAVDEICAMLTHANLPYLRIGSPASCDPRFRSHLIESALNDATHLDDIRHLISATPIIVGTTSTLQARQEIFCLKQFSLCIVDEASQILEPNLIGLLAQQSVGRFILIGDYKQLPAVVQQNEEQTRVSEQCLIDICLTDCRQSLFERLIRWEQRCGRTQFTGILDHQGRMHPAVAHYPCTRFYAEEQLQPVPLDHQKEQGPLYSRPSEDWLDDVLKNRRVVFFDSREREEAAFVATLLCRIHRFYGEAFDADKTVGVIVPYRSQIGLISQALSAAGQSELLNVSIDTVERYQGSQRDVIIYSFAVDHRYQLDFLTANTFTEHGQPIDRKLNVAMTRARRQLIMTGRADILRQVPLFRDIIDMYAADL
jgi:hypothetical protein